MTIKVRPGLCRPRCSVSEDSDVRQRIAQLAGITLMLRRDGSVKRSDRS